MELIFGEYKISTNKDLISLERVCDLLSKSYWANQRSKEKIKESIKNSICIGIYDTEKMIGFARIVTDYATMYWLCDVIIDEQYRGNGLGKKLIESLTQMEELKEECLVFWQPVTPMGYMKNMGSNGNRENI